MTMRQFLLTFLLLLPCCLMAQVKIEYPDSVDVDSAFRISFIIQDSVQNFKLGDSKEIKKLAGPYYSSHSSFSVIGGKTISEFQTIISFKLKVSKIGKCTINPSTYYLKSGKKYTTPQLSFWAVNRTKLTKSRKERSINDLATDFILTKSKEITAVESKINKKLIHLGDSLELTFQLYTNEDITSISKNKPDVDFCITELQQVGTDSLISATYKGNPVSTATILICKIIPLKTEIFHIPSLKFEAIKLERYKDLDPFEAILNPSSCYEEKKITLTSNALSFTVIK